MKNPLVEKVERELQRLEFPPAELIHELYSEENFGNAQAIYRIGNLYLNFIRDRDDDTVDFINPRNNHDVYIFDDISILMKWKTIDEMVERANTRDFSQPPTGPISLGDALKLIKKSYGQLQDMFSPEGLDATLMKLRDVSRKRSKALFG